MVTSIERVFGHGSVRAQVVGFQDGDAVLIPLGDVIGVGPDSPVVSDGTGLDVMCGPGLLGRVLDGLGTPMDGGGPIGGKPRSAIGPPPHPLKRRRVSEPFFTGVRAIDGLLTLGEGQRIGLFAGSGVGKSTLLGQIARGANADVVVICLVGERGREVRAFLEDSLGEAMGKSVVVCATSDAPPLVRLQAGHVATTIAEHFRDEDKRVLLLLDSVTRLARAQREVGLAAGEPPVHRGFPPSVFELLPRLMERAGCGEVGSITAIYTVLVAGDDMHGPIADEVRGILDGHIVLSRRLAERGHWPAVDVSGSLSRLMPEVAGDEHRRAAARFRRTLAVYEDNRDLIALGAYKRGSDVAIDHAIESWSDMETFLCQPLDEQSPANATLTQLRDLCP
jgi:type III secretion protein N (ATPase)